jgi:hypothetical protein
VNQELRSISNNSNSLNKYGRAQTTDVEFRGWTKTFCFRKCDGEGEYPLKVIPSFMDESYNDFINSGLNYPAYHENFDSHYESRMKVMSEVFPDSTLQK